MNAPYIAKPIKYDPYRDDVAWALCKCGLPLDYALAVPIDHEFGLKEYPFKCSICGFSGTVVSSGRKEKQEWIKAYSRKENK